MSVQFGRWNFDGQLSPSDYIEKVSTSLAPYGPDGYRVYSDGGLTMLYRPFHTTKESHDETQPAVSSVGVAITWDGRLDNRSELITELQNGLTSLSTDVAIVAAAYERWKEKCFCKFIGDWALSIWNPVEKSLTLAKDFVGTRHLFYWFDDTRVTWCTILDPLIQFGGKKFEICEEYVASWLANQFPAPHLTPYVSVQAVPPSCFVLVGRGRQVTRHDTTKYWDFNPNDRIRYRTDAEYQEHFRFVFGMAVQRRLRSDRPVLAELSGGMDSSSIVCMADLVMGTGAKRSTWRPGAGISSVECPRLDTISWFGDRYERLEPDTNDFAWISRVEQMREREGFHINFGELEPLGIGAVTRLISGFDSGGFACTPAPKTLSRLYRLYATHMASGGHRVAISGIGGDSATGKEPTSTPELQNLVVKGRIVTLIRQLNRWASKTERPRGLLLWEAIREFLPRRNDTSAMLGGLWFRPEFIRRNQSSLSVTPARVKLFGPLPAFQHDLHRLNAERRLAACWDPTPKLVREVRYPFLDRDFLSFMYAIPREQVVREGRHRFLMKQALVGIVPDELLYRERKAFVRPASEMQEEKSRSAGALAAADIGRFLISGRLGIVDPDRFSKALQKVSREEKATSLNMLKRTMRLELWLRHLASYQVLVDRSTDPQVEPMKTGEVALGPAEVQLASSWKAHSKTERR